MVAPGSPLDEDAQDWLGCPLQIGQVLAAKYRIEQQIGRGGMGIVLSATHLQLEHRVAIKVMRRDLLEDDKALDRLLAEARAAAKIRSEHVARVLDVGTLENGFPFIVMEYLEGEDLAELLDRQGALDVAQAVQFLLQSCEALAEVHVAEMIHRDLKPGNLFIAKLPDGSSSLKIVDFGISKHIGGSARGLAATTSSPVLGSPYYMPPEQMRAEPVDERSDIWSLGAILFEMLTGRPPFLGETLPEVYAAVLGKPAPSIETLRPSIPAGLDDVVQRCLDKDPAQRFCDVADLAEALAPFGGAASLQSVEKITRILTNPELVRARASSVPRVSSAPEFAASGAAREAGAMEPQPLLVVGSGTAPGFGPPEPASPILGALASNARSMSTSSELGPLSATGALGDREPPRTARPRLVWAAVATAAGLVGLALWIRTPDMSPSGPAAEALPLVTSSPVEATSGGSVRSSSSRVSAVADPGGDHAARAASRESAAPGNAPSTRQQALKPAAPAVSVDNVRAAVMRPRVPEEKGTEKKTKSRASARREPAPAAPVTLESAEFDTALEGQSDAPSASPPAPAPAQNAAPAVRRTESARDEDPWNPSSFGDRR